MAFETLVAVYDTAAHADAAVRALKAAGFHESDISVFDGERLKAGKAALSANVKETGLWNRLFGTDVYQHEAAIYGQTIQDGGVVISLRVPESEVAHASAVLDIHRPVDVHDRAVTLGVAPAAHVEAVQDKIESVPLAAVQNVAVSPKLAAAQPEVLRLAEEQLQVGKELAEIGPHPRAPLRDREGGRRRRDPARGACRSAAPRDRRQGLHRRHRLGRRARSR